MAKHEMEYGILSMSYEEMCKYIFKKNMDKEIKSERRRYINGDTITNEKIAAALSKRKICKDIKKIVKEGKIDDD